MKFHSQIETSKQISIQFIQGVPSHQFFFPGTYKTLLLSSLRVVIKSKERTEKKYNENCHKPVQWIYICAAKQLLKHEMPKLSLLLQQRPHQTFLIGLADNLQCAALPPQLLLTLIRREKRFFFISFCFFAVLLSTCNFLLKIFFCLCEAKPIFNNHSR